jgi:hypothetical protein
MSSIVDHSEAANATGSTSHLHDFDLISDTASPDKKGLLFGSIVEEKKARVSRQLGSIPTERNGGIASPASTRKSEDI